MPNRLIHTYWIHAYNKMIYEKNHPKEAQDNAMGQLMNEGIDDLI